MRFFIVLASFLFLAACAMPDDSSVKSELREESTKNGLALVRGRGSSIAVIPFDGPEAYFASEWGVSIAGFGKAGGIIAWAGNPPLGQSDFIIDAVDGKVIAKAHEYRGEFFSVALSEAAGRFTYLGPRPPSAPMHGLYWASFDLSKGGFIDVSDGDNPQGDWSPDGRFVTYQKKGSVYIFEIASGSSRRLAAGDFPAWSQSGDRISFRAPDGRAALVTVEGKSVNWALGTYHPLSPIRWSPDGKYVVFSTDRPLHVPLIGAYYDLLVCRVSDGRSVSVRRFGPGSGDLQGFYWITDYRHFCAGCQSGQPFN